MSKNTNPIPEQDFLQGLKNPLNRRSFLQYTGAGVAASALLLAGCDDDDDMTDTNMPGTVNLGSNDVGILNYAYALEQLEAAFYTAVVALPNFSTLFTSATERQVLTDIRNHEVAHREFFKAAITAAAPSQIIPSLTPKLDPSALASRASILATAKTFEDLGVAAYNGAGKLLTNPTFLSIAGKIVSVEARHAAEIRDMIENGTFASGAAGITSGNIVDANGLDVALTPAQVLAAAQPFIQETINGSNLPTT
ncbi:ferritin-like domain-containing protein [Rufibacter latericius]|uniref:Ferritin-like domain-containing protein n=1 Tax=Rufibacter latericius TaxID=2487040 RepID=A0A3M9MLU1_9BACT|nr:ferritin-like domain-containing protein [Rufibacter latericius]RNI25853.1 ferritin-like domain-containing protein [Rufibacter latericius]